jgi:glycosyltransferase involved in cell wall biosynthesis
VVLIYDQEPQESVAQAEKRVILGGKSRFCWEQKALAQILNSEKIDLYHATWNYGIPLFYHGPSVLTVHDVIPLKWPTYFYGRNVFSLPEYLVSIYLSFIKASSIITDSQSSAKDVTSVYPLNKNRITVIHLGVDNPRLDKNEPFDMSLPYIIYFGGVDKRKNIIGLMRAFSRSESLRTHRLVIVGKNSDILKKDAQNLGIIDKTDFIGYVSEEKKYALLKKATALVYPSFYEGFGIPPLEAMSVGTPVIASNTSCFHEIIGNAGLFIDPNNISEIATAIDRLVIDLNLQEELRRKGYEQVTNFSWDRMVEKTIKVYREVIDAYNIAAF